MAGRLPRMNFVLGRRRRAGRRGADGADLPRRVPGRRPPLVPPHADRMEEMAELVAVLVDETMTVAAGGTIYDDKGDVLKTYEAGCRRCWSSRSRPGARASRWRSAGRSSPSRCPRGPRRGGGLSRSGEPEPPYPSTARAAATTTTTTTATSRPRTTTTITAHHHHGHDHETPHRPPAPPGPARPRTGAASSSSSRSRARPTTGPLREARALLEAHRGIVEVHLRADARHPEICIHYDAERIAVQVLAVCQKAGAEVAGRYNRRPGSCAAWTPPSAPTWSSTRWAMKGT